MHHSAAPAVPVAVSEYPSHPPAVLSSALFPALLPTDISVFLSLFLRPARHRLSLLLPSFLSLPPAPILQAADFLSPPSLQILHRPVADFLPVLFPAFSIHHSSFFSLSFICLHILFHVLCICLSYPKIVLKL